MKIRILEPISGIYGAYSCGEEVDWPDDTDAKGLIAAGVAEPIRPTKKARTERATVTTPVETADAE